MGSWKGGRVVIGGTSSFARLCAGRIVRLQVRKLADLDDIEALHDEVTAQIRSAGTEVVIYSDCRLASPVSREVAHVWARSMRQNNRGVVRSGIILDPANTMFNLQLERVVQCSIHPQRRLFDDSTKLCDWLGVTLSRIERDALRQLLDDARP